MTTKTTKTNTLQVNCFGVESGREMTNAELADYFRGIAEMFEKQGNNPYGITDAIVKFEVNYN